MSVFTARSVNTFRAFDFRRHDPAAEFVFQIYMDPQSATNEATLASDSARLEAEISRRFSLFNEIGRVVLSALDQDEIYKVAVDAIRFSMGLKHVALFLIDYQFSDLALKAQTGDFLGVIPNHIRKGLNV